MSQVKGNGATQPYPSAQEQTGHYGAVQHGAIENRALHKLAEPGFTPHTFFSYLIVQAMVLLAWWPKGGLFDRIDAAAEPVTLTAVAIYTGTALAYFALQLSADELSHSQTTVSNQASIAANARWSILQSTRLSPLSVVSKYLKAHAIQLLYLLALCTPLMAVAHALSSVPITALLWIALLTTVHTTFYRLLGSWLHLRWIKHDMLATVVSRALLAIVYLATVFLLPELSHISISFQLTQPSMISMSAPASTLEIVLIFLVTYSALCIVLCIALYMAVSAAQSHTSEREAKH